MAGEAKGIPEGASAIIPRLYCRDPEAEIGFCTGHSTPSSSIAGLAQTARRRTR